MRAARAWSSFDGAHLRSWLIRILRNEFSAFHRRRSSRIEAETLEGAGEPSTEIAGAIDQRLVLDQVVRELEILPEEYRLAVSLVDMEGMSYIEAALALEIPAGTLRSRLFRGRQMLRDSLQELRPE